MIYNSKDTIVAPSTASGVAALSMIRISGEESIKIANLLFRNKDLETQPSHTLHHGIWEFEGKAIDDVVVGLFRAPSSYTGENVVEVSCHGSSYIVEQIMISCLRSGARFAEPGEFTQRAFLNGKMDLAQAEAVAEVIASQSKAAHRSALHNLRGGFSNQLKSLREQLIHFAALMELELDFSQEDLEFADRTQLYALIERAEKDIKELIQSFALGNVVKNGVQVAIVGKPNSGKSTLLNALLQEERAIVSDIAGTTRDTIEEVFNINGILFRLIDTAGIREHTSDDIESVGVSRSLEKMKTTDWVLYIFDCREDWKELQLKFSEMEKEGIKFLPVGNKMDLVEKEIKSQLQKEIENILLISAKNQLGLEELKKTLYGAATQDLPTTENTILTNTRHLQALEKTLEALEEIHREMDEGLSGDLITPDIHRALHYLGSITGEIQTDRDVLGAIFSKFCIGK